MITTINPYDNKPRPSSISLFTKSYLARSKEHSQSRIVNFYVYATKDEDQVLYPTPGMELQITNTESATRALHRKRNNLYFIADENLYQVDVNGSQTLLGTLLTSEGPVSITSTNDQLTICDQAYGYSYDFTTAVFEIITDEDFPADTTTMTSISSFTVAHSGQEFFWSDVGADTVWQGILAFGTAERIQQDIVAVYNFNEKLYVMGDSQTELWQVVGGDNPFDTVPGILIRYGCAASKSVANSSDKLFMLARGDTGQIGVISIDQGYNVENVSRSGPNFVLEDYQEIKIDDAVAFCWQQDGEEFYQITFPTVNKSWLYNITLNMWTELESKSGRHYADFGIYFNNKIYINSYKDSNLYAYDLNTFTNNGEEIIRTLVSPVMDHTNNRIFIDHLMLYFSHGTALQTGQGSDPKVFMQTSNDGGNLFNSARIRPIGKIGQHRGKVRWSRVARGDQVVLKFTMSDPVQFIINAAFAFISYGIN